MLCACVLLIVRALFKSQIFLEGHTPTQEPLVKGTTGLESSCPSTGEDALRNLPKVYMLGLSNYDQTHHPFHYFVHFMRVHNFLQKGAPLYNPNTLAMSNGWQDVSREVDGCATSTIPHTCPWSQRL